MNQVSDRTHSADGKPVTGAPAKASSSGAADTKTGGQASQGYGNASVGSSAKDSKGDSDVPARGRTNQSKD
ncbi:hypothetical protein ACJZ2D_005373 [Fusarium nematophilum]